MVIIFDVKEAREYLLNNGEVYTLRANIRKKMIPKDWATDKRNGKKIANVLVMPICIINFNEPELLQYYVHKTGFSNVDEWLSKVKLKDSNKHLFLYHVVLRKATT